MDSRSSLIRQQSTGLSPKPPSLVLAGQGGMQEKKKRKKKKKKRNIEVKGAAKSSQNDDAVAPSRVYKVARAQTGALDANNDKMKLDDVVDALASIQSTEEKRSQLAWNVKNNDRDRADIVEHLPLITEQPVNDDHNTNPNEDIESNDKIDLSASVLSKIEELDHKANLDPNTFSFLISSSFLSVPFLTGIFVFLVKNGIFALTLVNIIDFRSPFNKLGVPVTVAQAVSIAHISTRYRMETSSKEIRMTRSDSAV